MGLLIKLGLSEFQGQSRQLYGNAVQTVRNDPADWEDSDLLTRIMFYPDDWDDANDFMEARL